MLDNDIGPIPAGWQIKTLPQMCSMQSGGTPPKSEPAFWAGEVPWVSGKDLKAHRLKDAVDHITLEAAQTYSKIAPAGSVLVLVRGMGLANGFAVSVIECPMAFNQDLKALIPKGNGSGSFLMYALTFAGDRMLRNVAAAAHGTKRLSQDDLDTFRLAIPDPDEQRLVARVLDIAVEAAIVEKRAERAAQELKRAAMRELFTRGLRGEPQKDTDIGRLSQSWEVANLTSLCMIRSGGTPPKSDSALWQGDVAWVSGKDLKTNRLRDSTDHISQDAADNYSEIAPAGSVLVLVRGMGLAKRFASTMIERAMAFNQDLKALIPGPQVTGAFLMHSLTFASERMLQNVSNAAHGTKRLSQDDLDTFKVGVPNSDEQREIVAILDAIDRKIDLHKRKRAVLEELFQTLLHKLMTGEIRVSELDLSALPPAAPVSQEASV